EVQEHSYPSYYPSFYFWFIHFSLRKSRGNEDSCFSLCIYDWSYALCSFRHRTKVDNDWSYIICFVRFYSGYQPFSPSFDLRGDEYHANLCVGTVLFD